MFTRELFDSARALSGFFVIEELGVEHVMRIERAELSVEESSLRIQLVNHRLNDRELSWRDDVGFIQPDDVRELNLIDEEIDDSSVVCLIHRFPAPRNPERTVTGSGCWEDLFWGDIGNLRERARICAREICAFGPQERYYMQLSCIWQEVEG